MSPWTLFHFMNFNIRYFEWFLIIRNKWCILRVSCHFFILGDSGDTGVRKSISEIDLILRYQIDGIGWLWIPEILIILIINILLHHIKVLRILITP